MAQGNEPGKRDEDLTPEDSSQVVRLPVEGSETENADGIARKAISDNPSIAGMPSGQEVLEDNDLESDSGAEDLGVGWDTAVGEGKRTMPMGWVAAIIVLMLLLGGWALVTLSKGAAHLRNREAVTDLEDAKLAMDTASAERWLERLEMRVKRYLQAPSITEKVKYVRDPQRVLPLMESYYLRHTLMPGTVSSIENIRPTEVGIRPFFFVEVTVEGKEEVKFLLLEDCEDGELRFDWESEVGYQPMEIASYIETKPTESMVFRVYAELDSFYSYEYVDQGRYQAFKLTFRDEDEFLFGYADRKSVGGRGLLALLQGRGKDIPVLLRLRFSRGTKSRRSVLIEEVLATSWVWSGGKREDEGP